MEDESAGAGGDWHSSFASAESDLLILRKVFARPVKVRAPLSEEGTEGVIWGDWGDWGGVSAVVKRKNMAELTMSLGGNTKQPADFI